jgi:hypothetical protein
MIMDHSVNLLLLPNVHYCIAAVAGVVVGDIFVAVVEDNH